MMSGVLAQWEQSAKRLKIAAQLCRAKRNLSVTIDDGVRPFAIVKVQLDLPKSSA